MKKLIIGLMMSTFSLSSFGATPYCTINGNAATAHYVGSKTIMGHGKISKTYKIKTSKMSSDLDYEIFVSVPTKNFLSPRYGGKNIDSAYNIVVVNKFEDKMGLKFSRSTDGLNLNVFLPQEGANKPYQAIQFRIICQKINF